MSVADSTVDEVKDSQLYEYLRTTKDFPDYWAYDESITNATDDITERADRVLSWSVPNFDKQNGTTEACTSREYCIFNANNFSFEVQFSISAIY